MSRLDELRTLRDFIDREIAAELGPALPQGRDNATVRDVADLYGVEVAEILGGNRRHQVTRARQAVAWLLRRQGFSLRDVARAVGYTDHSTVTHAIQRVERDAGMRAMLVGLEVVA